MRLRLLPEDSPLGWTPYGWLVYLSFFLVWSVLMNQPRDWLIDVPALLLFLLLYFRAQKYFIEGLTVGGVKG